MTNAYYNHTSGVPVAQSRGLSASVRAEFDAIAAAFDALAAVNGSVNQPTVTVASATLTPIGAAASDSVIVSGTTTITAFDTVAAGIRRFVVFSGALVLTHNGASLVLPGAANITTVAGDAAEFVSLGNGNWRCVNFEASTVTGSGATVRANLPSIAQQAIQAPALLNSWVNFGAGYSSAGYWKDPFGMVHLQGLIKSGTVTGGTTLFVLPAGYRPSEIRYLTANSLSSSQASLSVDTSGNVVIISGFSATNTSLDGICFRL